MGGLGEGMGVWVRFGGGGGGGGRRGMRGRRRGRAHLDTRWRIDDVLLRVFWLDDLEPIDIVREHLPRILPPRASSSPPFAFFILHTHPPLPHRHGTLRLPRLLLPLPPQLAPRPQFILQDILLVLAAALHDDELAVVDVAEVLEVLDGEVVPFHEEDARHEAVGHEHANGGEGVGFEAAPEGVVEAAHAVVGVGGGFAVGDPVEEVTLNRPSSRISLRPPSPMPNSAF